MVTLNVGVTRTFTDTAVRSQFITSVPPFTRTSGIVQVRTSVNGPSCACTAKRICDGLESGGMLWNCLHFGSSTIVQSPDCRTTNQMEYLPLGTACPSIVIALSVSRVVA